MRPTAPATGQSLAYRWRVDLDFGQRREQIVDGAVYLDADEQGTVTIGYRDGSAFMPTDPRSLFPIADRPVGRAPVVVSVVQPSRAELRDTFQAVSWTEEEVVLKFTRAVVAHAGTGSAGPALRGRIVFDRRAGRYRELTWRHAFAGTGPATDEAPTATEHSLTFDDRLSAERTRLQSAKRAALRAGERSLDEYVRDHSPQVELAAALSRASAEPDHAWNVVQFHLAANPEAALDAVVAGSGELWPRFFERARDLLASEEDLLRAIRSWAPRSEQLRRFIAESWDERFAGDLERIRAAGGPLARTARESLAAIERTRSGRWGEYLKSLPGLAACDAAEAASGRLPDPWPLVPAMLTLMEVRAEDAWDCSTSSVLYYVTLEPDAAELEEWRAFWTAHGAAGRTARLIGVAREDRRRRLQAMLELSKMQPSDDGRRLFADRLGDDDPMVRLSAARSLARWHDPRGAALLVRALEDGEKLTRLDALLALAGVAGSTLGFDPQAGEVERAEAVGRWREWLRRREQPSGPRDGSAGVQYWQARLRTRPARIRESPAAALRV